MKYARINETTSEKQLLTAHIDGVINRITEYSKHTFPATAKLIGYLHDLGKYSNEWQNYLFGTTQHSVNHSPHGAHFIQELFKSCNLPSLIYHTLLSSEIIEYVILAHHGLFDAITIDGQQNFLSRLKTFQAKYSSLYEECKSNFLKDYKKVDFQELCQKATNEIKDCDIISSEQLSFDIGFVIRVLLSMTIDADWSDAGAFTNSLEFDYERKLKAFTWNLFINRMENKICNFPSLRDIDYVRRAISEECFQKSKSPLGIYKLDVPTGGGKTFSVMRFALNHAKEHNMERIFYIAPFISILEQNAEEYKKILIENDSEKSLILSHYTDIINMKNPENHNDNYEKSIVKFTIDNWSSPIILTTMVQFLLTLFSASKQSIRRAHRLSNSVIIIDEFQSVPLNCTGIFNLAINALNKYFHSTIVLCTATQPPFENHIQSENQFSTLPPVHYSENPDLVPSHEKEEVFKRTSLIDLRKKGGFECEDLVSLIFEKSQTYPSILVVLNTRNAVKKVCKELKACSTTKVYALTNDMCPAHRNDILNEIKSKLQRKENLVLISTSLIEAGVDISFSAGIRSLTGLDIMIQAAGRINRHNEMSLGELFIVNLNEELENISKMKELINAQRVMNDILDDYQENPKKYDKKIGSKSMLRQYFLSYFQKSQINKECLYPIKNGKKDVYYLTELLGKNEASLSKRTEQKISSFITQSFYFAGSNFHPLGNETISLLVPYTYGEQLILVLNSGCEMKKKKEFLNATSYYSISVYKHVFEKLKKNEGIIIIPFMDQEIYTVRKEFYSQYGLEEEKGGEISDQSYFF